METYEQKKRRLFGKQYLPIYLEELNKILHVHADSTDLLSIVESDKIRQSILAKKIKCKFVLNFDDKEKIREIIFNNVEKISSEYYVFTSYSIDCGTLLIKSLTDFNFNFSFKDLRSGIITLTRSDFLEEIILDFYEEDGNDYLEIEIYE